MASTQELIATAIERFQDDVPALANLKLVFELELRGRGDVQQFRVEVPGPEISKGYAEDARVNVSMPRSHFNELATDGKAKHYVEAYPETEIVATDPDADLAIIRVKNVEAKRFARLPLAKEPVKDQKIFSYGYPGSSLAKHAGLVSKDGKILSLVRFPAYDDRYARLLRENAVDGDGGLPKASGL